MRLLVFDLDGTLLEDDHSLSKETVLMLEKLVEMGFLFTVATGRSLKNSYGYLERLPINLPVILFNGARIYNLAEKRYLFQEVLENNAVAYFLEIFKACTFDVAVFFFIGEDVFSYNPLSAAASYLWRDSLTYISVNDCKFALQKPITKIVISASKDILDNFQLILKQSLDKQVQIVRSEKDIIEILPCGVNKGAALERLCKMYNIDFSEVVAVGDSWNDVEMLKIAGFGIAVGNATEVIKHVAKLSIPKKGFQLVNQLYKLIKEGELR
ncbi:HAD family hydrolase [Pseudothermotoga thermarum]|uniref:Cof-like hydrolase n=1 Tax=Pseudothermotoga thermarum DSM 5069 TaxID=688269 RepID=F7YTG1_9THEM|nr:HAD family hydrolase [Pseudothermotoga thermarum]AEH51175.1 Cof-like hydrolase [Pseudothermotoga thermarum DSM 5069]